MKEKLKKQKSYGIPSWSSIGLTSGFGLKPALALVLYIFYSLFLVFCFFAFNSSHWWSGLSINADDGRVNMREYNPHWFSMYDITTLNVSVLKGSIDPSCTVVSADFSIPTKFSFLTIEPDRVTPTAVYYTSRYKLDQINKEGLSFLAEFPTKNGVQTTRVLLVTILLSLLIQGIVNQIKQLSEDDAVKQNKNEQRKKYLS